MADGNGMMGTLLPMAGSGAQSGPPIGQEAMGAMTRIPSAPKAAPAPTYAQVNAFLHRSQAINSVVKPMLKDPKLGRQDVRDKMIEGIGTLMGMGVMTMAEAMNVRKTFPSQPADQQLWVQKILDSTAMAKDMVMDQYLEAGGNWAEDGAKGGWKPDSYGDDIQGLMKHYG